MKIFELRRNSDLNNKTSVYDFLNKYKDNPTAYLHTAPIPKVGINPTSKPYETPIGVYAYRIKDIWGKIRPDTTIQNLAKRLDYSAGNHLFILQSDINPYFIEEYHSNNLTDDIIKLRHIINNNAEFKKIHSAAINHSKTEYPFEVLYIITAYCASFLVNKTLELHYSKKVLTMWNTLLRKLGYVGFNDIGAGIIYNDEPSQAVFLEPSAYKIIDYYDGSTAPVDIFVNGETLRTTRLSNILNLKGITPLKDLRNEYDLRRVKELNIDELYFDFLYIIQKVLPQSSVCNVKKMIMQTVDCIPYHFNKDLNKITKNIHIKRTHFVFDNTDFFVQFLNAIPNNISFDQIIVEPNVYDNIIVDNIPERFIDIIYKIQR